MRQPILNDKVKLTRDVADHTAGFIGFIADIDDGDDNFPYLIEYEGCEIDEGFWVTPNEIEVVE